MSRTILAAGSGGHLMQLKILADAGVLGADEFLWVTDRTPQSESLLKDERVIYLPHRAPRDVLGVLINAWRARRLFTRDTTTVYSTGAGIALSFYIPAILRRRRFIYIESATRATQLSLTGKVLDRLPFVVRRVQHQTLSNDKWSYQGSVFDSFEVEDSSSTPTKISRIFVSLGANQHAGFRALIDKMLEITPSNVDLYFQYGPTDIAGLRITGARSLSWEETYLRTRESDVVVTHAGTGSILTSLMAGKTPLVVPRSASNGEHVDDHQADLASFAHNAGLAVQAPLETLSWGDVLRASEGRVQRKASAR